MKRIWIMKTKDGWYPIEPSEKCRPEDHGCLNPHIVSIEDAAGRVLWSRAADPGRPVPQHGSGPDNQ